MKTVILAVVMFALLGAALPWGARFIRESVVAYNAYCDKVFNEGRR